MGPVPTAKRQGLSSCFSTIERLCTVRDDYIMWSTVQTLHISNIELAVHTHKTSAGTQAKKFAHEYIHVHYTCTCTSVHDYMQ